MREPGWAVVMPVKRIAEAKTRLRRSLQAEAEMERHSLQAEAEMERATAIGVPHDRLVLALAQDTVRAVRACPVVQEVLVVTDDPEASTALVALGARTVPDTPAAGLNPALAYGASLLATPGRWIAALAADLPALRPAELAAAFQSAATSETRWFVPDAAGTGTTLLTVSPGVALDPRFGAGSAAAHAATGARLLDGDWPSLRRDVDTAVDLADAARLGLGPETAALWRAMQPPTEGGPPRSHGSGCVPAADCSSSGHG